MTNKDASSSGLTPTRRLLRNILRWIDSDIGSHEDMSSTEFNWLRVMPFIVLFDDGPQTIIMLCWCVCVCDCPVERMNVCPLANHTNPSVCVCVCLCV